LRPRWGKRKKTPSRGRRGTSAVVLSEWEFMNRNARPGNQEFEKESVQSVRPHGPRGEGEKRKSNTTTEE